MFSLLSSRTRNLVVVLVTAIALAAGNPARAERDDSYKNSDKVLRAFKSVVAKPSESTVKVRCDGKDAAYGTIVKADGWILTKASELKAPIVCKLKDGRQLEAKIMGIHEKYDLALLKIEAKDLKPVEFRNSKDAVVGDWVATPGLGEEPAAIGVVSVATRKGFDGFIPNSKSGFLGIQLPQNDDSPRIDSVMENTAAAKAGLQKGDLILAVNGDPVKDRESLQRKLGNFKPNDEVTIKVKRGEEEKEFKAKLGKRPQTEENIELMGPISGRRAGFPYILEHDTVLDPAQCGGPLVDLDGKTVGINIARAGRYESYAVPAEKVEELLPDFYAGKFAPKVSEVSSKLKDLKDSIAKFEEQIQGLSKKISDANDTVKATEKEKADLEKKLAEARDQLKKLEAESGSGSGSGSTTKNDKQPPEKK